MRFDWRVNRWRLPSSSVCFFRTVDDHVRDFLPGGAKVLICAWPVVERSSLPEDAESHIMHRQTGDDVRLVHGFGPSAPVHIGGMRTRRWRRLGLEFVDGAVEQGLLARRALMGRTVRH